LPNLISQQFFLTILCKGQAWEGNHLHKTKIATQRIYYNQELTANGLEIDFSDFTGGGGGGGGGTVTDDVCGCIASCFISLSLSRCENLCGVLPFASN